MFKRLFKRFVKHLTDFVKSIYEHPVASLEPMGLSVIAGIALRKLAELIIKSVNIKLVVIMNIVTVVPVSVRIFSVYINHHKERSSIQKAVKLAAELAMKDEILTKEVAENKALKVVVQNNVKTLHDQCEIITKLSQEKSRGVASSLSTQALPQTNPVVVVSNQSMFTPQQKPQMRSHVSMLNPS